MVHPEAGRWNDLPDPHCKKHVQAVLLHCFAHIQAALATQQKGRLQLSQALLVQSKGFPWQHKVKESSGKRVTKCMQDKQ